MSSTTTNLFSTTLVVTGVYFMEDFGKLKHVTGLKKAITHKAMVGVVSMQNALNILDPSGEISTSAAVVGLII